MTLTSGSAFSGLGRSVSRRPAGGGGGGAFGGLGGQITGSFGAPQVAPSPFDAYAPIAGVYDAQNRYTQGYLNDQMGWQNQGLDLGQRELNSGYGFDMSRLGLDQESLGIDRNAVGRQQGYYRDLYGIDTERYGRGMAFQKLLKDLRGRDQGSTLHSLWVQQSQARDKAMREERDMRRTQTAAGAFTSQGARDSARDIKADKDYALTGIDIAKRQADTAYRRDIAGINDTMANLTSDFRETGLNYREQQARLNDRLSTLDIESRRLGISRDELASKLALGLERLKLNHQVSVGQLLDAKNQSNLSAMEKVMNLQAQAMPQGVYG